MQSGKDPLEELIGLKAVSPLEKDEEGNPVSVEREDRVEVKIIPDFEKMEQGKRGYANFLSVSHDKYGFVLTFCDTHLDSLLKNYLNVKDYQGTAIVKAPIIAQIIISPQFVLEAIAALQKNYEKYVEKNSLDGK
jgi:hypothetical protein